jgi:hypothetical protein
VNNELEMMWKEVVMALLMVLSQHFPEDTEENQNRIVSVHLKSEFDTSQNNSDMILLH